LRLIPDVGDVLWKARRTRRTSGGGARATLINDLDSGSVTSRGLDTLIISTCRERSAAPHGHSGMENPCTVFKRLPGTESDSEIPRGWPIHSVAPRDEKRRESVNASKHYRTITLCMLWTAPRHALQSTFLLYFFISWEMRSMTPTVA
jgi:hypothetical protein